MNAAEIAQKLDLVKYPRSWRGRCPSCDYGANTFSVRQSRNGNALVFCSSCQDRNGIREAVARALGQDKPQKQAEEADKAADALRKRQAALRLWRGSEPAAGTVVERYLAGRALPDLAQSEALRYRGDCHHPEGGWTPGMVALVEDVAGQPMGVHRTYIRHDGAGKAPVVPDKASLGPVWGGAIRLAPVALEIVIGEGIETAASAGVLLQSPAWSAVSAGNLAKGLVLPSEVRSVVIAADPDEAGERAAREAALRWSREGRKVRIARPNVAGKDFNDMVRGAAHG